MKRQIRVAEIKSDLRSRMTDSQFMEKYKLTPKGLESMFRKLLQAGHISQTEYTARYPGYADTVTLDVGALRFINEHESACLIPIYNEAHPEMMGALCDIAENGFTACGIQTVPEQNMRLRIDCELFFGVENFSVEVTCQWVEQKNDDYFAGFQLMSRNLETGTRLQEIAKLVRLQL